MFLTYVAGVVDEADGPCRVDLDGLQATPGHLHLVPLGHQVQHVDLLLVGPQRIHAQLHQSLSELTRGQWPFRSASNNDNNL